MRLRSVIAVLVVGALASVITSVASAGHRGGPPRATVRLVVMHTVLRAGEEVPVTVVNGTSHRIVQNLCLVLQRRSPDGWLTVNRSHGIDVSCPFLAGPTTAAHSRMVMYGFLWDDLVPGVYRLTLAYTRWSPAHTGRLSGHDHDARVTLTVRPFRAIEHHLTEKRLLRIALRAATASGDPHPTLIQHSEGTRFMASFIGSEGDVVFAWNWCYLIAERGHFVFNDRPAPDGISPSRHATIITLVVDGATGRVLDSGSVGRYPHLARLGPVTTDRG